MGLVAIAASSALFLGACGGGASETGTSTGGQHGPAAQSGANSSGTASVSNCVNSSQVLNNMQSYTGKEVTITGTVVQLVSPHAFSVVANGNNGGGILGNGNNSNNAETVLAVTKDTTPLTAGSPVQVTGTVQPTFDPNQAATFTGGNIGQGEFTSFTGKPYVQAELSGPVSANLAHGSQGGILSGGNSGTGSCASASDVLNNMQSYMGQQVTITGTVAQLIGSHAVTVAPTGNTSGNNAQPLLAVAKELAVSKETGALTPGSPVQITGTLQPHFDMSQAVVFAGSNLDQTASSSFNGSPYVQALFAGPVSANLSGNQSVR